MLELFRCEPLAVKLTRSACASRHDRARRERRHDGTHGQAHLVGNARCAECELGAAHKRGEAPSTWTDGAPIAISSPTTLGLGKVFASEASPSPLAARLATREGAEDGPGGPGARAAEQSAAASPSSALPLPRGAEEARGAQPREERMPDAKRYEYNGQSKTLAEWGAALGMSGSAMRQRFARGWSLEQALTAPYVPREERRRKGRPPKATKRARKKVAERLETVILKHTSKPPPAKAAPSEWSSTPARILTELGFRVRELRAPAGVVLIVEEG